MPGSDLRLTYEHATGTVLAEAQLSERPFWDKVRVRGGSAPEAKACRPVSSQLGAGHEGDAGPVDQVGGHRECDLAALTPGTVSYLHMQTLVALHGQPG